MMMNLFSMFDPCTGFLSMNWLSILFICFMPMNFWVNFSKMNMMVILTMKSLLQEIMVNTKSTKPMILFMSMFTYILIINLMGLLPYVFTVSAHLVFSLTMASSMWMALMLFGWINKTNYMFTHMLPLGTPYVLMPFMVIIETISNFMRPGSLAVRLSANMIAGHILMSLLGNNCSSFSMVYLLIWLFMGLMMFELAVAFIQSYVFMTLSSLYFSEI